MEIVGTSLPINKTGSPVAHHWLAETGLWNEQIRFAPFDPALPEDAVIIEVGGHTDAADSRKFRGAHAGATIHIYEPVPPFCQTLKSKWADDKQTVVHCAGMGDKKRDIPFSGDGLAGQGTYVMEGGAKRQGSASQVAIHIVNAVAELSATVAASPHGRIDLLHINCEGCEWEMLESLLFSGRTIKDVKYLQISFHNYSSKGLGAVILQYCRLHEKLQQTHELVQGVPFGWERWALR